MTSLADYNSVERGIFGISIQSKEECGLMGMFGFRCLDGLRSHGGAIACRACARRRFRDGRARKQVATKYSHSQMPFSLSLLGDDQWRG